MDKIRVRTWIVSENRRRPQNGNRVTCRREESEKGRRTTPLSTDSWTPWIRVQPDCMQISEEISVSCLCLSDPTSLRSRLSCRYLRCWLTYPWKKSTPTDRAYRTIVSQTDTESSTKEQHQYEKKNSDTTMHVNGHTTHNAKQEMNCIRWNSAEGWYNTNNFNGTTSSI